MINLRIIFFLLFTAYFYSCATGSMEYRSCRAAANVEKDYDRAESLCLEALEIEPDNPNVPYFLATQIYKRKNSYDNMAKMLKLSRNKATNDPDLESPFTMNKTDIPDGISFNNTFEYDDSDGKKIVFTKLIDAISLYEYNVWLDFYNQGIDFQTQKDYDSSLGMLNKAKLVNPNNQNTYIAISSVYLKINVLDSARKVLYEGYNIDSSNVMINYYIGDIESKFENFQKSEKHYKYAALNSNDPKIMNGLLYCYIDQGKNKEAIEYSQKLLDENPDDKNLIYNVAVLYQRLGIEEFKKADTNYKKIYNSDSPPLDLIRSTLDDFKNARKFLYEAKSSFEFAYDLTLDSSSELNEDNINSQLNEIDNAQQEMKKYIKQLDTIFIPPLQELYRQNK